MRLLEIIDSTFIGAIISKKQAALEKLDPDRLYVENIRSLLGVPTALAKVICELAVRQGIFTRRVGVVCPNDDCGRIMLTVSDLEELPKEIVCEICQLRGSEPYEFSKEEVRTETYYKLVR